MVRAVLVESPIEKASAAGGYEKEQTAQPHGDRPGILATVAFAIYLIIRVVGYPLLMIVRAERAISHSIKAAFVPRPPSLVVFPSVAVAATLFMGLAMSIMSAQVTGDISGVLGGVLLVVVSLPIALVTAIFLSFVVPARAYAHPSAVVAVLSSYSPYVLGALTGVYGACRWGKCYPSITNR